MVASEINWCIFFVTTIVHFELVVHRSGTHSLPLGVSRAVDDGTAGVTLGGTSRAVDDGTASAVLGIPQNNVDASVKRPHHLTYVSTNMIDVVDRNPWL